jgi:hypothetical protein
MGGGYSFYMEHADGIFRYIFSTNAGVKYAVYFAAASEYFGLTELPPHLLSNGYNLGITRMIDDEVKLPIDRRIKYTIKSIIEDFFASCAPQGILMVNYDDYDSKQEKRFRCFHSWFNSLNESGKFYKEDAEIILPDTVVKVSMIFLAQRADFQIVLQEFHETRNKLIEEK